MDLIVRIGAAVAAAVLSGLLWFLIYRDAARPAKGRILAYGPSLRILGFVCALCFLAIGYFTWRQDGFRSYAPFVICTILALMGAVLFLEAGFVRIQYGERGITTRSPWRGRRDIPWHAVTGYAYSAANRWHILQTRSHGRIRLSIYLRGLPEFFAFMEESIGDRVRIGHGTV